MAKTKKVTKEATESGVQKSPIKKAKDKSPPKKAASVSPNTTTIIEPSTSKTVDPVEKPRTREPAGFPSGDNSKRQKAGLQFNVDKIKKMMKTSSLRNTKIRNEAAVYCTAVIEYLIAEILELSGDACKANKRARIIPRHILLAVRSDDELASLFNNVVFPEGGTMPHIHSVLLPKPTTRKPHQVMDYQDSSNVATTQDMDSEAF
uniref:Histone H2A n=1 Tax=Culicoides sonorensis TaxID=179676 RepID=A0A336LTK0_CULSO